MSAHHGRRLYALVVATALVTAACGSGEDATTSATTRPPRSRYLAMYDAVCEAAALAADRPAAARTVFFDRAHQRLHELADDAGDIDRSVAARLLEAKAAAESAFDSGTNLAPDLYELAGAAATAVRVVGTPVPDTCEPEE